MTRDDIWEQSQAARAKGWVINRSYLPENIPDPAFPELAKLFRAFELISPKDVRAVIIGQDPYFTVENGKPLATGVAFAIPEGRDVPQSLARIKSHVYPGAGDGSNTLEDWVRSKGLLLLNAALTVPGTGTRKAAGQHLRQKIWAPFIKSILGQIRSLHPQCPVATWGTPARDFVSQQMNVNWESPPDGFTWWYHPVASETGPHAFSKFWDSTLGRSLVMRDGAIK